MLVRSGDKYLLQKRPLTKSINPGKMMAVGGRVELREDFHAAAAREVAEETGYVVDPAALRFAGVLEFGEGFRVACLTALFVADVDGEDIPAGAANEEGELVWVAEENLEEALADCIEDLKLYFAHVAGGGSVFALFEKAGGKLSVPSLRLV